MSGERWALVVNDDGVESAFLVALVSALASRFSVAVVAPESEQSWIGRAISRRRTVGVRRVEGLGSLAWAADGTPTDCVNLALGSLLPVVPSVVVSGVNLGVNVSLPLVLSSGTVAGATEAALWGLPAVASSLQLPREQFEAVSAARGHVGGEVARALAVAAARTAEFVGRLVGAAGGGAQGWPGLEAVVEEARGEEGPGARVHNLNFPAGVGWSAPLVRSRPAHVRLGSVFEEVAPGRYDFRFPLSRQSVWAPEDSDVQCLARGAVSWSVLDWGQL